MNSSNIGPIVYSFSYEDIRTQHLDGFLALFTEQSVSSPAGARALMGAVHINLDLPADKKKTAPCEIPEVRAFCKRLMAECPILPWIAALSTPFYMNVIYSILPEIRVTYFDDQPGKYRTTFPGKDMENIIEKQVKAVAKIAKRAKVSPVTAGARVMGLQAYLQEGKSLR